MKSKCFLCVCIPLLLASCSAYEKVSITNFSKYGASPDELVKLHNTLKRRKLHYSDTAKSYEVRNHRAGNSSDYDSYSVHVNDNIVIPTGAVGTCIQAEEDLLIIDFGEGVIVPFVLTDNNNRARNKIEVDGRGYTLMVDQPNASLYFDTGGLKKPECRPK